MNVWSEKVKGLAHDPRYFLLWYSTHLLVCVSQCIHLSNISNAHSTARTRASGTRRQVPPFFHPICKLVTDDRTCIDRSYATSDQLVWQSSEMETSWGDGRSAERRKGDMRCRERREHERGVRWGDNEQLRPRNYSAAGKERTSSISLMHEWNILDEEREARQQRRSCDI